MKTALSTFLVLLAISAGGFYAYSRVMQTRQLRNLASDALKRQDYSLTVPEGKRREEIAQLVNTLGICSAADFMAASSGKEGYLFPDTYRFFKNTPAAEVVLAMTDTFTKRTIELNPTPSQVILASIVEREAIGDTDRALIAGIYQQRLNLGMKLQADPTVQYAKDTQSNEDATVTYWKPITQAEYLSINSPFNTYLVVGLPPTAIANAGLQSLAAAVKPTATDQLYFLYRNKKLLTSKTLEQHLLQE